MGSELQFRQATVDDVDIILQQRCAMFEDMQVSTSEAIAEMAQKYPAWLTPRLETGEYKGWFALNEGVICAGVGVWFRQWQPSVSGTDEDYAYLLNVYTEKHYRKQGIARKLVQYSLEVCRTQGIKTFKLHASNAGRPLYESLGFKQTNEMILNLK